MPSRAGVRFREVMRGGFTAGETDPAAGARDGLAAGRELVFHVVASIPDVARFVHAVPHAGTLGGTVTFDPIGAERAAAAGHFELFTPTPDPELSLMIYRVSFRTGSGVYFLDGAKHVRRQLIRSWSDTTTLWCRLHAGADATAPIAAAGVLHISPGAFAQQLVSFRPIDAGSIGEGVAAFSRFFMFFSGQLLGRYVLPRRG